jgi:hypothetical protein
MVSLPTECRALIDASTYTVLEDLVYQAMEDMIATKAGVLAYVKARLREHYLAATDDTVEAVYHVVLDELFEDASPTVN